MFKSVAIRLLDSHPSNNENEPWRLQEYLSAVKAADELSTPTSMMDLPIEPQGSHNLYPGLSDKDSSGVCLKREWDLSCLNGLAVIIPRAHQRTLQTVSND